MPVDPLPVLRQDPRHPAQDVRRQVRDLDPRQDEEPQVVRQEAEIPAALVFRPADEPVPRTQVPRRRRPRQARQEPLPGTDHVLQMLAHRLRVSEIVVGLDQAVEHRLLLRTPNLPERQRKQVL